MADGKIWMIKCGWQNVDDKMRIMKCEWKIVGGKMTMNGW